MDLAISHLQLAFQLQCIGIRCARVRIRLQFECEFGQQHRRQSVAVGPLDALAIVGRTVASCRRAHCRSFNDLLAPN